VNLGVDGYTVLNPKSMENTRRRKQMTLY